MAKVYVGFDDYGLKQVDEEFVRFVFDVVVSMLKLSEDTEAGVVISTEERMQELNSKYRGKDQATNVLSFSARENDDFVDDDENYLGDIYISRQRVQDQAKESQVTEKEEFVRLMVHGLLHLTGMHHGTAAQTKKMEGLEDQIIEQIFSV